MKIEIKKALKKYTFIESSFRVLATPIFVFEFLKSDFKSFLRRHNLISNKYAHLEKLRNSHCGERCFVVATGPSLTFEDLNLIKDEFSFGMNSGVYAIDKTNWIPNILGVQDEYVYQKIEKEIVKQSEGALKNKIFVGEIIAKCFKTPREVQEFPLHYLNHKFSNIRIGKIKFSEDCSIVIYDAYSIIFSLLQLACYMGFKDIYLLGCDCNYNLPKSHFIETGHVDPKASIMGEKILKCHNYFYKFAQLHGVNVTNCTRGGMLNVYPRRELDDVLKEKNK